MTDTTATTNTGPQDSTTPPWGSAANFTPERAWTLIQNLRTERDHARAAAAKARAEADALTTQVNTLTIERDTATATAADTQARLEAETASRTKDRLLTAAGLDPDTYAPLLTGTSEDEWATTIKTLTDLRDTNTQNHNSRPDPAQGAEPATDDRAALAATVFGS